jgi:hypothetical protein
VREIKPTLKRPVSRTILATCARAAGTLLIAVENLRGRFNLLSIGASGFSD